MILTDPESKANASQINDQINKLKCEICANCEIVRGTLTLKSKRNEVKYLCEKNLTFPSCRGNPQGFLLK